jgi:hypothetical protein
MFDYLVLRWKLWRLARGRRRMHAAFDRKIADARKRGAKAEELRGIQEQRHFETGEYSEEVYQLHTRYLFSEANRLVIPTGEFHAADSWEEGPTGVRHLTIEKITEPRALVRAEKRANREMWIPLIAGLTGIVGAITGLLSIWLKK